VPWSSLVILTAESLIMTLQNALKYKLYQFNGCEYSGDEGRTWFMSNRKWTTDNLAPINTFGL
jgi:hypothetical protein